jgi:hypothetical protein
VADLNDMRPGTVTRVEVLPFHQMGRYKWAALGRTYALEATRPPSTELTERVRDQFRAQGLGTYWRLIEAARHTIGGTRVLRAPQHTLHFQSGQNATRCQRYAVTSLRTSNAC